MFLALRIDALTEFNTFLLSELQFTDAILLLNRSYSVYH